MRNRSKVTESPILKSWDDVDQGLRKIAYINLELEKIETEMQKAINDAKSKANKKAESLQTEKIRLEKDVEDFAVFNKCDFDKTKRSMELNFAVVGYRKSSALKTLPKWTWNKVLAKLKEAKRKRFIAIKESVNKTAIREANLSDDEMAVFGVHLEISDDFWYEVKEEAIQSMPKMDVISGIR
jgi:phage host-nuclease inhibitor protein Gam